MVHIPDIYIFKVICSLTLKYFTLTKTCPLMSHNRDFFIFVLFSYLILVVSVVFKGSQKIFENQVQKYSNQLHPRISFRTG